MSVDPTYVPVVTDDRRNPFVKRMSGYATHGMTYFDVPFISEITPGFYQGGCENGLVIPENIEYVISLYKWERYKKPATVKAFFEYTMLDSLDVAGRDEIVEIATLVNQCRKQGPTLVHCQAGLNRSGLIAATAMILDGLTPKEAITTLREGRSPAVLCNPAFEEFVLRFHESA